jgi:hypothetical protein
MSLEKSIEAPRIHLEGNQLYYEPGIIIPEDNSTNKYLFSPFDEKNLFFGGVNAVTISEGFSDSRRGGTFQVV